MKIFVILQKILNKKFPNKRLNIKVGHNRTIPFKNDLFDLLMTNTLHYENNFEDINLALKNIVE